MLEKEPLTVRIFGGPKITAGGKETIRLSPKMATATGLASLAGPQGIGLHAFLSFLWSQGDDRILTKRLTALIRSFQERTGIASPVRRDGAIIFLDEESFCSDLSDWEVCLTSGHVDSAYSLLKQGVCPLHLAELTAEGDAFISARRREMCNSFEHVAVKQIDRAALKADWETVIHISSMLHDLLPKTRRYLENLITALNQAGLTFEAKMHQEVKIGPYQDQPVILAGSDLRGSRSDAQGLAKPSVVGSKSQPFGALLGRDQEATRLVRMLTGHNASVGRTCIVDGHLGLGKTRLLRELARYASAVGFAALYARVDSFDNIQIGHIEDTSHIDLSIEPFMLSDIEVRSLLGVLGAPGADVALRDIVDLSALRELSYSRPLLLCVDDVDNSRIIWKRLCTIIAAASDLTNLTVVASATDPTLPGLNSIADAVEFLTLSPLSLHDRYALSQEVNRAAISHDLREELANPIFGSPGFVIALAQDAKGLSRDRDSLTASERGMPQYFHTYLRGRVARLEPTARQLTDILACARHEVPLEDLAIASNLRLDALYTALGSLKRLNILRTSPEGTTIASERIRRMLEQDIPPSQRYRVYRHLSHMHVATDRPHKRTQTALYGIQRAEYKLLMGSVEEARKDLTKISGTGVESIDLVRRELALLLKVERRDQFRDPEVQRRIAQRLSDLGRPDKARYWFNRAAMGFRLQGEARKSLSCQAFALGVGIGDPEVDLSELHPLGEAISLEAEARGWWEIADSVIETRIRAYDHESDVRGIRTLHERTLESAWVACREGGATHPYPPLHALSILCQAYVDADEALKSLANLSQAIRGSRRWHSDVRLAAMSHAILVMLGRDQNPEGQAILRLLPKPSLAAKAGRSEILGQMNMAVSLLNAWDYDAAIDVLTAIIRDHGHGVRGTSRGLIHLNLATAWFRTREVEACRTNLAEAIRHLGSRPSGAARSAIATLSGLLALEEGNLRKARDSLDYLDMVPKNCPYDPVLPAELRGRWHWYRGLRHEAVETLTAKVQSVGIDAISRISIARVLSEFLRRSGRSGDANNVLREAATTAKENGMMHMAWKIMPLIRQE